MDIPSYLMGRSAGSKNARTVVVDELPETGQPNIIYLVPKQTTGQDDVFDEYIWVNNNWELIGSTTINMSNYLAKDNTTLYTPTGDYNPATKKYVDDGISSVTGTVITSQDTSITVTPQDNKIYKYETLSSLTITNPPSTGTYSIIFTSGSTATTTVIPSSILGLESFSASANTIYEINVSDNRAVVGSWVTSE